MVKKSDIGMPINRKWFLSKSVGGLKPGVYTHEERLQFPDKAARYTYTLSYALSHGLLDGDLTSGPDVNSIDLYAKPNKAGELPQLKDVKEGLAPGRKPSSQTEQKIETFTASDKKIDNPLRKTLAHRAKFSTEDSLRAQITAAKAARKKGK